MFGFNVSFRVLIRTKIRTLQLSFSTAKELRGRAELLPGGPRWRSIEIKTSHPTKQRVYLYWRDALECIAWLLNHPMFQGHLDWTPRRAYTTPERNNRIYTEWMTGDDAWDKQVRSSSQTVEEAHRCFIAKASRRGNPPRCDPFLGQDEHHHSVRR